MQTDDLNEMVSAGLDQHMESTELEPLPTDAVSNMEAQIVPKVDTTGIISSTYEPETEEALIAYAANIHNRAQMYSISGYWEIGRSINAFYKGKYGTNELNKIAKATGIGRDTLNKMIKFSRQYSREQVQTLLSSVYPMPWFHISQNLSVAPDKIIEVYQETENPKQFHNVIMKFKDAQETRGKSRKSSVSIPSTISGSTVMSGTTGDQIADEAHEGVNEVNMIQASDDYLNEMATLREENKKLRAALEHREYQVNQMQEIFHESALENRSKDKLIERLKGTINQVHDMVENGCEHVNILEQIDWRVE